MLLRAQPLSDSARRGRLVELDVLPVPRIGNQPRLELLDPVPVRVLDSRSDPLVSLLCAEDDPDETGFGLVARPPRRWLRHRCNRPFGPC